MQIQVRKPKPEETSKMQTMPIWEHGQGAFPWHYDDQETCLILEGKVTVKSAEQEVTFTAGDYVVFPKGLSCQWTIHEPVKKHYVFG